MLAYASIRGRERKCNVGHYKAKIFRVYNSFIFNTLRMQAIYVPYNYAGSIKSTY